MAQSLDVRFGVRSDAAVKAPVRTVALVPITTYGLQTVNGVVLAAGDRVLRAGEVDQATNGFFVVDTGEWPRAPDADSNYDLLNGTMVYVLSGTSGVGVWKLTTTDPLEIGVTDQDWNFFFDGSLFGDIYVNDAIYIGNPASPGMSIERAVGTNDEGHIKQNGTGSLNVGTVGAAGINFKTNNITRMDVASNAYRLDIGRGVTTETVALVMGQSRSGNGISHIDLIGDTTYTDYGGRLIRNSGANGNTDLIHKGTGILQLSSVEAGSIALRTTNTDRLIVASDGRVYGKALHNNAGDVSGTVNQQIASGTYTPTVTGVSNLASITSRLHQWKRVGNVVTVSGRFLAQTAANITTSFRVSLPIASNFSTIYQLHGTFVVHADPLPSYFEAEPANDEAFGTFTETSFGSRNFSYTFQYEVL